MDQTQDTNIHNKWAHAHANNNMHTKSDNFRSQSKGIIRNFSANKLKTLQQKEQARHWRNNKCQIRNQKVTVKHKNTIYQNQLSCTCNDVLI